LNLVCDAMKDIRTLCRLDEIDDGKGRGFNIEIDGIRRNIFVVRKGSAAYGYRNICPHAARRIDWDPDDFTDPTGEYILCSNHDARFRIEDGVCFAGPCRGQRLNPVSVRVDVNGFVVLASRR